MAGPTSSGEERGPTGRVKPVNPLALRGSDWGWLLIALVGLVGHVLVPTDPRPTLAREAGVFPPIRPDWVPEGAPYLGDLEDMPSLDNPFNIPLPPSSTRDAFQEATARLTLRPLHLRSYEIRIREGRRRGLDDEVAADARSLQKILAAQKKR